MNCMFGACWLVSLSCLPCEGCCCCCFCLDEGIVTIVKMTPLWRHDPLDMLRVLSAGVPGVAGQGKYQL
jgi:hypothetical protein